MLRLHPPAVTRLAGAVGLVLAVGLQSYPLEAGERTAIGERIKFSDDDSPELPEQRPDERHLSKPFEFLDRGNSIGGVTESFVAPLPRGMPSPQRNPRLWELIEQRLDQKKSWVYGRSEDMGRQPTLEEMFGVRKNEREAGKASRSGLARFFEERDENPKGKSLNRRNERASNDLNKREPANQPHLDGEYSRLHTNEESRAAGSFEPNRLLGASFGGPDGLFNSGSVPGRMTDFTSHGPQAFVARKREDQATSDQFRILLTAPSGVNPLALGFDPINLRVDTTRQELNPITPAGLNNGLPGSSLGSLDPLRAVAGPPSRGSLSVVEDGSARVLGSSSLSPAVATPTETRYSPPAPIVLEFPKRKF